MLGIISSYEKLYYRGMILPRNDIARSSKNAKPEGQKSPGQLIVRISNYFDKWMEISEVGKMFEGKKELLVREQFTNSCSRDVLSSFLNEQKSRNLKELAQLVEQYLDAHSKKRPTETMMARQDVKDNKAARFESPWDIMRCFACNNRGHRAVDCSNKASILKHQIPELS